MRVASEGGALSGSGGSSVAPSSASRDWLMAAGGTVSLRGSLLFPRGAACTSGRHGASPGRQGVRVRRCGRHLTSPIVRGGVPSLRDPWAFLQPLPFSPRRPTWGAFAATVAGSVRSSECRGVPEGGAAARRYDTLPPFALAQEYSLGEPPPIASCGVGASSTAPRGSAKRTRRPGRSGSSPCGDSRGGARRSRWFRSTEKISASTSAYSLTISAAASFDKGTKGQTLGSSPCLTALSRAKAS